MVATANLATSPAVAGPLGSLALSAVQPHGSAAMLRAVKWHDDLRRLGIELPFSVVHDLGMILSTAPEQLRSGPRCDWQRLGGVGGPPPATLEGYRGLLDEARRSEAARQAPELRLGDDLVVVVLARLLGDVGRRIGRRPAYTAALPLDASLFEKLRGPRLVELFRAVDRTFEREALEQLVRHRLLVLTLLDALDIDTLRLFGMLGSANEGALAQVELLASLETPEANDVVNFSLEILPAVLESKAPRVAGTMAAFGYAGLGRRGSIDNLVLTELSWDDLELARRIIDNEVLYYAREQSRQEQGRMHHLLIDASASMRGDRATFARAMALATGKKLLLEGEEVSFRFFDSRLYEAHRAHQGDLPTGPLLSFKGERGRNPARVFEDLVTVLQMVRERDARPQIVHVYTHAALYIPRSIVESIRAIAQIACVFMLPSGGKLELDYLDLLHTHWVVDHAALQQRKERAVAARSILEEVGTRAPEPSP